MSQSETQSRRERRSRAKATRRRRTIVWWFVIGVVVLVLLAGGLAAKHVYDQAMTVRGHLESAMADVQAVQKAVLAGDSTAAASASARLSTNTSAAVAGINGRLWQIGEYVPFVGANLSAVSQVAQVTDGLARDVVAPASKVNLKALVPAAGQVDLKAMTGLSPLLEKMAVGVDDAARRIKQIDRSALVGPVADGVKKLDGTIEKLRPYIKPAKEILSVLPDALGANGPRTYLLMFQGNSEARSLGGNAAVDMVLRVEDGRIAITETVTSKDFRQPAASPVAKLDPQAVTIYGDKIGRYTPDFTMVPDFPAAAEIFHGWWTRDFATHYDAVMSVDPVALSYILKATGPVGLPTGDVLDASNAVPLLLNGVYFRYPLELQQNAFFGAAANAVFDAVTSGRSAPLALMSALAKSADEGRLLYTSSYPEEQKLVAPLRMSGIMPHDNTDATAVGVYVNDNTASKKSYYLNMAVSACAADATVKTHVELSSTLTQEEASRLAPYIAGRIFPKNLISTYMVLYGPVGTTLKSIELDGKPATILSQGQHLGRPAVKVEVLSNLVSTHTIDATFDGLKGKHGPLEIWHTPMTRDTPTTVQQTCGG